MSAPICSTSGVEVRGDFIVGEVETEASPRPSEPFEQSEVLLVEVSHCVHESRLPVARLSARLDAVGPGQRVGDKFLPHRRVGRSSHDDLQQFV